MLVRELSAASADFEALVEEVVNGTDVLLTRSGKPVARITAYQGTLQPRKPGSMAGEIWIARDFDSLSDDIRDAFGIRDPRG